MDIYGHDNWLKNDYFNFNSKPKAELKLDSTSKWGSALTGGAALAKGIGGLASAYTGYKALGLAEDQFAFDKESSQRDAHNQAKLINQDRRNAAEVGLAIAGIPKDDPRYTDRMADIKANDIQGTL